MTALKGFRVLELSEGVAGEYCGKLLADFGAEVIKLEKPGSGSPTRRMGPLSEKGEESERSGLFAYLNTNKSSVVLDTSTEEGINTLKQLLDHVDVVVDDHSGEWLGDLGLNADNAAQNWPGLVVCSITPYGLDSKIVAEDINVFHSSGWGYHTPSAADETMPPLKGPGRFTVSYEAALDAAFCVVSSLYEREESQQGNFIEISKQAVMASRIDYVLSPMIAGEAVVNTDRRAFDLSGPSGIFPCRDGYVYIWMSTPTHWDALLELMGRPEWQKDFSENWLELECTPERVAVSRDHITEWLKTQDKHIISAKSQELGLTMVPVNTTPDLLTCEQYQYRQFFQEIDHPVLGRINYPTVPYKLNETPASVDRPSPLLGQHTEEKFSALNVDFSGEQA